MFAYDYPILGVFWSMVWLFLWIAWIFLLRSAQASLGNLGGVVQLAARPLGKRHPAPLRR